MNSPWAEQPIGYRFDAFELNRRTRELYERRTERSFVLEPKLFGVLLHLLEHRSRVVSKDELLRDIWGGQVVCPGAVPQCVSALRKALGDTGRNQRILRTHYCVGYRLVCSVEPLFASAARQVPSALAFAPDAAAGTV